jgi:hypothetical protein
MKGGGIMAIHNWPLLAKLLSIIAHRRLNHVYRAAFCLDGTEDNLVVVVFGNDEYSSNDRCHHDVESFREALTETGNDELGFSVSPDGESWVLLTRPDLARNETYPAKVFQLEMLKASLDDFVEGKSNPFLPPLRPMKSPAFSQSSD